MLLYCMGKEAESIYGQLTVRPPRVANPDAGIAAEDAGGMSFDRTVEALDNYFTPRDNHLHYAVLLGSRVQLPDESNEKFIRNVHELAVKCSNWDDRHRQDMLRTQLLAGMKDKELSRELQLRADITLEQIKQQMRTKEVIARNQKAELDGVRSVQPVGSNSYKPRNYTPQSQNNAAANHMITDCSFCGYDHVKGRCPAYNKTCNGCHLRGHLKKKCTGLKKSNATTQRVSFLQAGDGDVSSDDDMTFNVHTLDMADVRTNGVLHENKWLLTVNILDHEVRTKVDTGAQVSTMAISLFTKLGGKKVTRTNTKLTGYGNKEITVVGRVKLDVQLQDGKIALVKFYVTDDDNQTLLGMPAIKDLGLLSNGKVVDQVNEVLGGEFSDVLTGLGKVGEPVTLELKHDAKPRAAPPRVVPHRLK
ncbi:uncharacterized protein [Watersipora subatra]|uniref:uncharacterized protein n=1 Tax=Watersipora subatra TaxID=2589382 RepID=UPI00355B41BB